MCSLPVENITVRFFETIESEDRVRESLRKGDSLEKAYKENGTI